VFVECWNSIQPNKPRLFLPHHTHCDSQDSPTAATGIHGWVIVYRSLTVYTLTSFILITKSVNFRYLKSWFRRTWPLLSSEGCRPKDFVWVHYQVCEELNRSAPPYSLTCKDLRKPPEHPPHPATSANHQLHSSAFVSPAAPHHHHPPPFLRDGLSVGGVWGPWLEEGNRWYLECHPFRPRSGSRTRTATRTDEGGPW